MLTTSWNMGLNRRWSWMFFVAWSVTNTNGGKCLPLPVFLAGPLDKAGADRWLPTMTGVGLIEGGGLKK